jgi:antitoxin (DNA-binding transcriptional repressor) of toxin-antitoxin stability system
MKVAIRQLKDRLSEYLQRVRRGEAIQVTRRGEVVAEIRSPLRSRTDIPPGLARLAERGVLRLGAPNDPTLYPVPERALADGAAAELLGEERGAR